MSCFNFTSRVRRVERCTFFGGRWRDKVDLNLQGMVSVPEAIRLSSGLYYADLLEWKKMRIMVYLKCFITFYAFVHASIYLILQGLIL